jgi:hypothetical protein
MLYLYCVTRAKPLPLLPVVGVAAAEPPYAIVSGALAAIVSWVPDGEFNGAEAERRMGELAWMTVRAKSHEAVIEAVMRQSAVVPAAVASILRDEEEVRAYLAENFEKLDALLDYFHQREEWVVRVLFERPVQAEPQSFLGGLRLVTPAGHSRPLPVPAQIQGNEQEQRVVSASHEICHRLRMSSSGFAMRQLAFQMPGSDPVLVVGNWAFLVSRAREEEFRAAVRMATAEFGPLGFEIRVSGPWPPFSFSLAPPAHVGYAREERLAPRQTTVPVTAVQPEPATLAAGIRQVRVI